MVGYWPVIGQWKIILFTSLSWKPKSLLWRVISLWTLRTLPKSSISWLWRLITSLILTFACSRCAGSFLTHSRSKNKMSSFGWDFEMKFSGGQPITRSTHSFFLPKNIFGHELFAFRKAIFSNVLRKLPASFKRLSTCKTRLINDLSFHFPQITCIYRSPLLFRAWYLRVQVS